MGFEIEESKICDIRLRIGQQIKSLRLSHGWSLRDLEAKSGINNKNLSAIENGKYNIRLDTIEKLEKVFNIQFGFRQLKDNNPSDLT